MSSIILDELLREKLKSENDKGYIISLQKCLDKKLTFDDFLSLGRPTKSGLMFPNRYTIYEVSEREFMLFHPENISIRMDNATHREALEYFWENYIEAEYNNYN